jgi:antitoxin YefM
MRAISISNDIVPIAEFKSNISKWFKILQTSRHPLIITQNSKPAGVLLSASDYDELVYRKSFLDSVEKGIADTESGRSQTTGELRKTLQALRNAGNQGA